MLAQIPALRAVATETPHTTNSGIKTKLEKAKFNLSKLKDKIESSLLESENGSWPSCDEHFKNAVDLITTCYGERQDSPQSPNPMCIAVLEDYLCALLETDILMLGRETLAIKRLTNKALREINTTKKTVVPDEQVQFSVTEIAVKKTLLYIKNQFLPAKPILPPQESLVEKIKKKGLAAYTYISQTIEEHPTITGVAGFVVVAGGLYWIYYQFSSDSGSNSGGKPPKNPPAKEDPLRPNGTIDVVTGVPSQGDGVSCGYHSTANAFAFAQELTKATEKKGKKLTFAEILEVLKSMAWPSKAEIQGTDKAAFVKIHTDEIESLTEQLNTKHKLKADQIKRIRTLLRTPNLKSYEVEAKIAQEVFGNKTDDSFQDILTAAKRINALHVTLGTEDSGWIDGSAIPAFARLIGQRKLTPNVEMAHYDLTAPYFWDAYETGQQAGSTASVENTMLKILTDAQTLLGAIKDKKVDPTELNSLIKGLKNPKTCVYDQETLTQVLAAKLTLADILALQQAVGNEPSQFLKFLNVIHHGIPLILNWRKPGHWICNIIVPDISTSPIKAKGFVVDSGGSSIPFGFTTLLNRLITQKPLTAEEEDTLKKIFAE